MHAYTQSKASLIRVLLAGRGWTRAELASKTGISYRVLNNVICGGNKGRASRAKVEAVLETVIWTDSNLPTK